jgi:hypothetical protein
MLKRFGSTINILIQFPRMGDPCLLTNKQLQQIALIFMFYLFCRTLMTIVAIVMKVIILMMVIHGILSTNLFIMMLTIKFAKVEESDVHVTAKIEDIIETVRIHVGLVLIHTIPW